MDALTYITLPESVDALLLKAVEDLNFCMEGRYGVGLQEVGGREGVQQLAIHLRIDSERVGWSPGSYTIFRDRSSVVIEGWDAEGVVNGIYGFCRDILGARWYWPEAIGFEWLGQAPVTFPDLKFEHTPTFVMRNLHPIGTEFGRRNRLKSRYSLNHALANVFSKDVFEESPEVFPVVNGNRRAPKGSRGRDSHPILSLPKTVEITADAAVKYFKDNPDRPSFSLSLNDNVMFDEGPLTEAAVTPLKYFRGRLDYTDYVFEFNNRVAEIVFNDEALWQTEDGSPRYLPALAYYWTEQSPTIPVHPRVMPILTSGRAQWHDPEYRAEDKALIQRWAASGAETLATWDYYFGAPYPYPRQFNQWIAESIPFLAENNVTVFFSQLPSTWGLDGAKAWLAAELLWDSSQDAGALLDEYYSNFFGAAGESIRAFYETAETHRNANAGRAVWIKYYYDESGLPFDPKVLAEMRGYIEKAKTSVLDDERRARRVEIVSEAFGFTERYYAYQHAREALADYVFGAEEATPAVVLLEEFISTRERFRAYAEELIKEPLHAQNKRFLSLTQSEAIPAFLGALAQREIKGSTRFESARFSNLLEIARSYVDEPSGFSMISINPDLEFNVDSFAKRDFMGPALPSLSEWKIFVRASEGASVSALDIQGKIAKGLRFFVRDVAHLSAEIKVEPERNYIVEVVSGHKISPDNRTRIRLNWKNAAGEQVRSDLTFRYPVGESEGRKQIAIPTQAPADAYSLELRLEMDRFDLEDYFELERFALMEAPIR
jgi:hypothetical protein